MNNTWNFIIGVALVAIAVNANHNHNDMVKYRTLYHMSQDGIFIYKDSVEYWKRRCQPINTHREEMEE